MIGAKQFAGITFQLLYFCNDYPVYDISYSYFFCDVFIIYIFLLVSVCHRVVLNAINHFFFKQHRTCFYSVCACAMCDEKYVLQQ